MSHEARNWAFMVRCVPGNARHVLLRLADHHNGQTGRCDPSVALLVEECGYNADTISVHLGTLRKAGLISIVGGHGKRNRYILHMSEGVGHGAPLPDPALNRSEIPGTSEPDHPEIPGTFGVPHEGNRSEIPGRPPGNSEQTTRKFRAEPGRNQEGTRKPITSEAREAQERKASRLPPEWRPSSIDRAFAADLGLDADAIADEFRDYWIAVPGAKGTKLDWSATWRNHCRRQASRRATKAAPRQPAFTWATMPKPAREALDAVLEVWRLGEEAFPAMPDAVAALMAEGFDGEQMVAAAKAVMHSHPFTNRADWLPAYFAKRVREIAAERGETPRRPAPPHAPTVAPLRRAQGAD